MGELEPEYEGRVDFVLIPAEETAERADEIEAFGFTDARHGLVIFTSAGDPSVKMPGHDFSKEEIVVAIELVLAEDS